MGSVAIIFVIIFTILMAIPCAGVAWIGSRLINQLGRFPSRTPAIQLSVVLKLTVLEVVSWTLLLLFFKVLVAE
mgnify:CR=1 FL=1